MNFAGQNSRKLEFSRVLSFRHSSSYSWPLSWCPPSNPVLAIIYFVYLLSSPVIRGSNVFISEIGCEGFLSFYSLPIIQEGVSLVARPPRSLTLYI